MVMRSTVLSFAGIGRDPLGEIPGGTGRVTLLPLTVRCHHEPGREGGGIQQEEQEMVVPGAYFRDETIWRGRIIGFACDLKATLYELGFWAGAMYVAAFLQLEGLSVAVGVGVCVKMLFGYLEEMRGGKRAEREIGRYVNETYRS
jgi:hypothetical protein